MNKLSFYYEGCKKPAFLLKKRMMAWFEEVVSAYNHQLGTVSFIFATDDYILEMNRNYLGHDYYTDVITFDYTENKIISGDIFISLDTVKSNASDYNVSFEEELYRVMVHGILHLIGFKDKTEEEASTMRKQENEALEKLKTF